MRGASLQPWCSRVSRSAALLGSAPAGSAATTCDRFAAPAGSDTGTGTLETPFRTAGRLVDSLAPGETGCFRGGLYSFGVLNVNRPDGHARPVRRRGRDAKGESRCCRRAPARRSRA